MTQQHIPSALRRLVRDRAGGRCEYCLVPEAITLAAHEVDHIIAQKHGGATTEDNLALSCTLCNKHKGSDIASLDPETGELIPLFDPRRHQWIEHFEIAQGRLLPRTAVGRVTVRLLQLNQARRITERIALVAAGLVDPYLQRGR